jgi:hypothetical protein
MRVINACCDAGVDQAQVVVTCVGGGRNEADGFEEPTAVSWPPRSKEDG